MTAGRLVRTAARVLLVDETDRLLLIEGLDPAAPERGTWWFTPGGGREAGETAEQAALREVREETGRSLGALVGPLWQRTTVFPFDGEVIEQTEEFFTARVPHFIPGEGGRTEQERRSLLGARWWWLDEIETSTARLYPENLGDLLRRALQVLARPRS